MNTRSIDELLDEWNAGYAAWFDRHHTLPPALRAARLLEQRFAEPLTLERSVPLRVKRAARHN